MNNQIKPIHKTSLENFHSKNKNKGLYMLGGKNTNEEAEIDREEHDFQFYLAQERVKMIDEARRK